jgi:hypothetical protein
MVPCRTCSHVVDAEQAADRRPGVEAPHGLRHGVVMEAYGQHRDLEQVRGLLGHGRIETTEAYAKIQPERLKQSVNFCQAQALETLRARRKDGSGFHDLFRTPSNPEPLHINKTNLVAPTGVARLGPLKFGDSYARHDRVGFPLAGLGVAQGRGGTAARAPLSLGTRGMAGSSSAPLVSGGLSVARVAVGGVVQLSREGWSGAPFSGFSVAASSPRRSPPRPSRIQRLGRLVSVPKSPFLRAPGELVWTPCTSLALSRDKRSRSTFGTSTDGTSAGPAFRQPTSLRHRHP